MSQTKHIISLGAGVQSSTMALMAAAGEIEPMPTAAIFADTQVEPKHVYTWLEWLEDALPFPVIRATAGDLMKDSLQPVKTSKKSGKKYIKTLIPAHVSNGGLFGRKCTADYKIVPIRRATKEILGLSRNARWPKEKVVTQWLGISLDEIQRMKTSVEAWMDFRHPLIELRMTRGDCLSWMQRNGYPEPPRSACFFCPFHSNEEWKRLAPEEFEAAVQFEKDLQELAKGDETMRGTPYLHSARIPLDVAIDQNEPEQLSWLDECAGMCGV